MTMQKPTRRDFLKLLTRGLLVGSGLLGLGALARYLGYQVESPTQTEFDLGVAENYPTGSRTLLAEVPAVLVHAASGFSALSLTCTHLGCTLEETGDGFACPCHGSRFSAEGDVRQGPAARQLNSLKVAVNQDGHVILYTE